MYYAVCEHVCASVRLCVAKLYYVRHKFASSAICANDIDIIDIHWIWWPFAPDADYLFYVSVRNERDSKMWPNKRKLKKVSRLADKLKYLA